jgi:Tfp pilus assembly protein PilN
MMQLNLLPDVKLEYLKAERTRRLFMAGSVIVTAAAVALLVLVFLVTAYQKHTLSNVVKDVSAKTKTLKSEPGLNSVLTVQSQLQSVNSLHAKKPNASQLFSYLNELTPQQVAITALTADFTKGTLTITGTTDALSSVNQFIDTLKFTKYSAGAHTPNLPAFNGVVLSNFSLDDTTPPPASYTITTNFDPTIFNITKNVSLIIPTQVTTRSDLEHPGQLFVPGKTSQSGSVLNGGSQ